MSSEDIESGSDALLVAEDEDVLHPVVVDQRLQAAQPEHRVEDGLGH